MTTGEDRVRIKFNPSNMTGVDEIKQKTAELIDLCEGLKHKDPRLASLAQTAYEEAAMWAVKAATACLLAGFFLFSPPANAQTQLDPNRTYNLPLNLQRLDIVVRALRKQPFEEVADLLNFLQQQINDQNAAAQEPKKLTPPAEEPKK